MFRHIEQIKEACLRGNGGGARKGELSWENDQDAQLESPRLPDGDTGQMDWCRPLLQAEKHWDFREQVLGPPNISDIAPLVPFCGRVPWAVFSAKRSLKAESSVQAGDPRRLKCLSGSGCYQHLLRCLESDKINCTVENWQIMERRHKAGDLEKCWCFDELSLFAP